MAFGVCWGGVPKIKMLKKGPLDVVEGAEEEDEEEEEEVVPIHE